MPDNKYKVVIYEKRLEKRFASLKSEFSNTVWSRMLDTLSANPKGGKREMQYRKYDLPDGNRILYDIIEDSENKITRIVFAGNHNDYMTYLRKLGKKRK